MVRVSVIVPCFNEESTIYLLLNAVLGQSFPKEELEVVIADGMSKDQTRNRIDDFKNEHPELIVRVVDNIKQFIPSGLNRAIENSVGEYIVRLDGHSVPARDYIERCVRALEEDKGENVGGVWEIRAGGTSWQARSIAEAAAHPFGVGDALYRYTTQAAYVDTVPFGAFRRDTLIRLGCYDETLLTNEDYELNTRIRQSGGRVWLDPLIRSIYYSRSSFEALAKQYFRYGFWKQRMLRRYPGTMRLRQGLPPLFVLSLLGLLILGFLSPVARILLLIEVMVYLFALLAGGLPIAMRKKDPVLAAGIPGAIIVMHLSWGVGFWMSLLRK
jgi:glycosyltransferase involved in cell wall biosynthesis